MSKSDQELHTSLDLVGDGDEQDLLVAIEESFGFEFANDELNHVETFGQLYDAVLSHLPNSQPSRRTHCRSALAFRRLRHAMRLIGMGDVRPSTPLRTVVVGYANQGKLLDRLECQSGLALGQREMAPWTLAFGVLTAIGLILWQLSGVELTWMRLLAGAVAFAIGGFVGGMIIAGVVSLLSNGWGTRFDRDLVTVGDLANRAAHLNFARLGGRHDQRHPQDVWRALEALARMVSSYAGPIDRDTRILAR